MSSPVRFISFDAYAYGERLALYPDAVKDFLRAGKTLLWGVVPTTAENLASEDRSSLTRRLTRCLETLVARGVPGDALLRQSMVTPACGLAGLDADGARRAMALAGEVAAAVRERLGGDAGIREDITSNEAGGTE